MFPEECRIQWRRPDLDVERRKRLIEESFQYFPVKQRKFVTSTAQLHAYEKFYTKETREFLEGPIDKYGLSKLVDLDEDLAVRQEVQKERRKRRSSGYVKVKREDDEVDIPDSHREQSESGTADFEDPMDEEWMNHQDDEESETEEDLEDDDALLQESYITMDSNRHDKTLGRGPMGSLWEGWEKEMFFTFLGRYGISQVDKIQERIPTKSVIEIMAYYDLLSTELEKMKKSTVSFQKLLRYDEIPEAIEVDVTAVALEDTLAYDLKKVHKLWDSEVKDLKQRFDPDENALLDVDVMNEVADFYRMPHLCDPTCRQLSLPMKFMKSGYKEMLDVTEEVIRDIVTQIIHNRVHSMITSRELNICMDSEVLQLIVRARDVLNAVVDLRLQRPLNLKWYYKGIGRRLHLKIIDEDAEKTGVTDELGRDEGQEVRINHEQIVEVKPSDFERFMKFLPEEDELESEDEEWDDDAFIVDDEDSNSLLDNNVVMAMTMMEAEEIDIAHREVSKSHSAELMKEFQVTEVYKKQVATRMLKFDKFARRQEKYYKQFQVEQRRLFNRFKRSEARRRRKPGYVPVEKTESDINPEGQVTEEMLVMYSYTFPEY